MLVLDCTDRSCIFFLNLVVKKVERGEVNKNGNSRKFEGNTRVWSKGSEG